VACSDGSVRLINSFSGKLVHRLIIRPDISSSSAPSEQVSRKHIIPTSVLWSTHFAEPSKTRGQLKKVGPATELDDLLGLNADMVGLLKPMADLPLALGSIDVDESLPRLATLPPTNLEYVHVYIPHYT